MKAEKFETFLTQRRLCNLQNVLSLALNFPLIMNIFSKHCLLFFSQFQAMFILSC